MYDHSNNITGSHKIMKNKNVCSTNQNNWILLDEGSDGMKGVTIIVEESSGTIISVSTRTCPDTERWKSMPPLTQGNDNDTTSTSYDFTTTQILDLHNSRYISELHPKIHTQLPNVRQLILTRCDRLELLPESICSLQHLQEVRHARKSHMTASHCESNSMFIYSITCMLIAGFHRFSND